MGGAPPSRQLLLPFHLDALGTSRSRSWFLLLSIGGSGERDREDGGDFTSLEESLCTTLVKTSQKRDSARQTSWAATPPSPWP